MKDVLVKMLDKNWKTRATLSDLKKLSYLNEGFKSRLEDDRVDTITELTEEEVRNVVVPIHIVVLAKKIGKEWHRKTLMKKGKSMVIEKSDDK